MKHNLMATANAAGATTGVIFIACRLLVGLFPDFMFTAAQSWFHGVELTRLEALNLTPASFVWGLISSSAFAWIVGYLFAYFYNMSVKK